MKIVRGTTTVSFVPEVTRRGHLASLGEPVDLTRFITAMDAVRMNALRAAEAFGDLSFVFLPRPRRHGAVKHRRDLRRARMKDEIRRMGWSRH